MDSCRILRSFHWLWVSCFDWRAISRVEDGSDRRMRLKSGSRGGYRGFSHASAVRMNGDADAYRSVMVFCLFLSRGLSSSSNPVNTSSFASSGSKVETSSSSVILPRSINCIAATDVNSLVLDAIHMGPSIPSGFVSSASDLTPNDLAYWKAPRIEIKLFIPSPSAARDLTSLVCREKHGTRDDSLLTCCFDGSLERRHHGYITL